ncbi:MAG TPA: hypothetical protein VK886_20675 [Vicinamibacterales bacterium]|nr:hypothetical protein [Vicinamibacterales bacterium]
MEMFLLAGALSLLGVVVSAVLFAASAPRTAEQTADQIARAPLLAPPRFFDGRAEPQPRVPIEALLLEIERHVRLEQAAAESFLQSPTKESLHSRTMSRLVH